MSKLSGFKVTERWKPQKEEAVQVYYGPTPNGLKVAIMLEECGLPYEIHQISFATNDQTTPEFLSVSPNNKIPAILDPNGPNGPQPLFESGAILLYLAEKTGKFLPQAKKWEATQWLMWQMGGLGPMFGQFGFFHKYAGSEIEDPRPRERYRNEAIRLLTVLEKQLEGQDWIIGTYSIADMAIGPWLHGMLTHYKGADIIGWQNFPNCQAYLDRFLERDAVKRAYAIK